MPTTRQQLDIWKSRLLDLSRRNRLIHTRPGLPGTVALSQPTAAALCEALLRKRPLPFAAGLSLDQRLDALAWEQPATGQTVRLDRLPAAPPGQLGSDMPPEELERALYNLRLRARTALTEQGLNVLFVALGFLHWFEPDAPEVLLRSPLLLLPVELQRAPNTGIYGLRLLEDEIVLNPTLAHKLRRGYGIALPELPQEDDQFHPEQIFSQIAAALAGHAGWQVLPEATLGLFSFLKLLMYHDLERAAETAAAHPILALLAGEQDAASAVVSPNDAPPTVLDTRPPEQCYQVLDADGSQAEAIEAARAGGSFVLQGPPGTGKSQTITNIISESLAQGKRVLFVSEKMAALHVVYERLREAGLAEFCLELHSHKASKRAVLDALGASLDAPPTVAGAPFAYGELAATRAQLNAYVQALHTPVGGPGWTAYMVYARVAALTDAPECDAPLGDLASYTPERLGAVDLFLGRLDARSDLLQALPTNPWRGCSVTVSSFEQRGNIRSRLRALIAAVAQLHSAAIAFAELLALPSPTGVAAARTLAVLSGLLQEPHSDSFWLADNAPIPQLEATIAEVRQQYMALADTEMRLAQRHQEGLLALDLPTLIERFSRHYSGWARVLRPQYYRDMATLRATLQPRADLDHISALADLQLAAELRAARAQESDRATILAAQLGPLFAGHDTPWETLANTAIWATQLLTLPLPHPLPAPLRAAAADPAARAPLLEPAQYLDGALTRLDEELAFFVTLFPNSAEWALDEGWQGAAKSKGQNKKDPTLLLERMSDLDGWWEFCELRRAAEPLGIGQYLDRFSQAEDPYPAAVQPRRAFQRRLCQLWLDAAYEQLPPLRAFQRASHEAGIERFRQLDAAQLTAAQGRLRQQLAARRPAVSASAPGGEMALLRRELQKQRRHKPIRQLFGEIPALLGQLKPCLLMSPLSVSQFLDPAATPFDLVIFDEASQIRTEDAVGAVMRGRALVVVGDNKQLPPTSFFAAADPEDEENLDAPDSFESILDASSAAGLPMRLLRWHYRSRHEALITFSNNHFYGGRLATFPVATPGEGHGISFEYVADGCYDRRRTRANSIEARRVADLVCARIQSTPRRSLGVVAFSQPQQLAILHELERRRGADPALDALFDEELDEPFFVKNLENVQGDERDRIIVSVGYGRDSEGSLLMNFGPLNQQGGERRLNVAITRARQQVTLVSSIQPEEIDLRRTTNPGPRLLRAYMEYARHGGPVLEGKEAGGARREAGDRGTGGSTKSRVQSGFEDALAFGLEQRGLLLRRQIGHSRYRIDIAICDPTDPERFLLGVECDGDDYRDAPTARDRERLREQVLGQLGWRIHRAWSAAWASDAEAEVERVIARLRADQG